MPIQLVLADDHPLVLDGLEQLFRLSRDFAVAARCRDGEETLKALRFFRPDILILDVRMPRCDGLQVLQALADEDLPTRVVLLTADLDEAQLLAALRLGVGGIVLKEMAPRLLVDAVRTVHAGGRWIEMSSANRALEKLLRREVENLESEPAFTPRELEIVRMVARGLRNRSIAEQLQISEGTVKIHLHNIYQKLDVGGRGELAFYVRSKGLA